jgi:hypothetical protein
MKLAEEKERQASAPSVAHQLPTPQTDPSHRRPLLAIPLLGEEGKGEEWCVMDASNYCRDRRGITRKGYRSNRRFDRWLSQVHYGMWTCVDGREVLFNRFYAPIAERSGPQAATRQSDTYAWIKWKRQEHFFDDGSFRPADRAATMMKLNAVLAAWGLPRLSRPPR